MMPSHTGIEYAGECNNQTMPMCIYLDTVAPFNRCPLPREGHPHPEMRKLSNMQIINRLHTKTHSSVL